MEESILLSVKRLLGISEDDDHFNLEILIHINSVLSILKQMGVGDYGIACITGDRETWSDFLGHCEKDLNMVKSYVYMKVRLLFDPPTGSTVMESLNNCISEMEWRIIHEMDTRSFE